MDNNRVWFVEDDANDVLLIQRAIRRSGLPILASFAVGAAQLKSMFVIAQLQRTLPRIIVTDLKLMGEDGFAIVRWVKSQQLLKHVPVFVLSSSSLEQDRQAANVLGAQAFLTKCSGEELAALLRETFKPFLSSTAMLPACATLASAQPKLR